MLSVLNVAFPFAAVGADSVGGAEQVIAHLDAALTREGHRSIVVACEGSEVTGTLVATFCFAGPITEAARCAAHAHHRRAIAHALRRWRIDLVHMHGIDFHAYLPPAGPPVLVTLHLPPDWYPERIFDPDRPGTFLHCVSASQRARCPPGARLLPEIPNGVPIEALAARHAKRNFAFALGRICPEKGFHIALDAARRAQTPLLIAGETFRYDAHETYFEREIVPRLDGIRRFIGPVGFARKRRLLSAARCLLIPSLAPETSSLVAMEALACGTPVIAFPSGALPEIVEHGRTGFLVQNERAMAEAIEVAGTLDPEACRSAARQRFSLARTTERYLELYRQLAARANTRAVIARPIAAHPGSAASGLEIGELTTTEELEALEPAWADLWHRAPAATPFQSPAWLMPWWRHIGGGTLRVLAARAGGRLVGLLPMYLQEGSEGEKLLPLGIAISDYLDGLYEVGHGPAVAAAMLRHLAERHRDWRVCELHPLPPGSPLLETPAPPGCAAKVLPFEPCPVLEIPPGAAGLCDAVPSRIRAKLRYFGRRAAGLGRIDFETASAATVAELLEALFELHSARWARLDGPGVLGDPAVQAFHRDAAAALLQAGLLRLHALRLDERIVAVIYALHAKNRGYYYISGFDPELAGISPGTLTIGHAIEQFLREGARTVDFLRGREPFKYFWGARDRPCYGRIIRRIG